MPTDDETKAKIVCNAELAEELRAVAALLESLGQLTGQRIDLVLAAIRLAARRIESIPLPAAGREELPAAIGVPGRLGLSVSGAASPAAIQSGQATKANCCSRCRAAL